MNMSFYTGATGAGQFTKKLSVVSNNLVNINNTGFKSKTAAFSELIHYNLNDSENAQTELQTGSGARVERTWTDFSTAGATQTGKEYDYAIMEPNAFFMIQDPASGEITYTRNGHFHRGERGDGFYLTTEDGKLVLDQNRQPLKLEVTDVEKLQEESESEDDDYDTDDTDSTEDDTDLPKVSVYTFSNPSRLLSVGDNEYKAQDGMEASLKSDAVLQKGALENSGTDMAKEMVHVIECQRALSYAVKMEIKRYEDMDLQALDVMREIGSIGTSHAATALSKLLQKEVRISIPSVNILGYNDAMNRIGDAEELVAAALVKMSGDIEGLMLFLFDLDFANEVLEKLLGSRYKSFLDMDEMARSALVEVGNIIICSYINAFSQLVNVEVELSVPSATINMLGGILMVPIAEYGYETDKLMYCNADFVIGGKALSDWLLMLPDIRSLNDILERLGVS